MAKRHWMDVVDDQQAEIKRLEAKVAELERKLALERKVATALALAHKS